MAVIDVETLKIEEVPATEEQVFARLDELCLELFGMSAEEFVRGIREGRTVDHPAAARLEVLAEAFI